MIKLTGIGRVDYLRRRALLLATAGTVLCCIVQAADAQEGYPSKPIRVIVPFGAGGGVDAFARRFMPFVGGGIGSRVVVDNKPGANTIIGTQATVQSAPDGYTLLAQTNSVVVNLFTQKDLPFDTFKGLMPVSLLARAPHVLVVTNSLPVKNVRELVDYAKANPNKLNFGSGGLGSTNHLAGEMFKKNTGIKMEHIAYKGANEYLRDLEPGVISIAFAGSEQATALVKAGRARALATTGANRLSELPNVPTMAQAGYPLEIYSWQGYFVPAGTPRPIIDKLSKEMQAAARNPKLREQLPAHELLGTTPEAFAEFLKKETDQVGAQLKDLGLAVAAPPQQK